MKRVNPVKQFFSYMFRKYNIKPYELVPYRTRIRQYIRGVELKSNGKISYESLCKRVRSKFEVELSTINITNKAAKRLMKSKKVAISKTDLEFEKILR